VAQQQCCGIEQIAIADNSVTAQSHFGYTGTVAAIGEQPIKMLIDPKAGARMAVGEMLTNMASVRIRDVSQIRCRANWMVAAKLPHEGAWLYDAAVAMSDFMVDLGIAIDGGKDSLSMAATVSGELVKAPGSLVVLGSAPVQDITEKLTPDIKSAGESLLALIDLGMGKNRLGGSALAQAFNQVGNECPDVDDPELLRKAFLLIQKFVETKMALSVHDRSDGGLITAVAEMCMANDSGFSLIVPNEFNPFEFLFNEELGFVLELRPTDENWFRVICDSFGVPFSIIGRTERQVACKIRMESNKTIFFSDIISVRRWWEITSTQIEKVQTNPVCANEEYANFSFNLKRSDSGHWNSLSFTPVLTDSKFLNRNDNPRVIVLREEGTNGDLEMRAACLAGGLNPWNVTMQDLLSYASEDRMDFMDQFQGLIFAGGFSYMDVFGSAKGWAGTILFNEKLKQMFDRFYAREDTFSLGVCNGCQLMSLLGWVPFEGIEMENRPRFIENVSGRFESRWAQVEVLPSPSIMLAGMEGSRLGVWVAHGEGRLIYPSEAISDAVWEKNLAPLAYIDPYGLPTEGYPFNPNGSPEGLTALCSPNGRHLAMMPHPERSFRLWQMPYVPLSWERFEAAPWLRMFQNAREWCIKL
jgi:phosphoribosylformylglycinamidine synthase